MNESLWEPVIGLEIHAELNTKSKLFSVAPNRFGDDPNTNITEVCTGMPGALPVLNTEAVKKAVQLGVALEGTVNKFSKFDRKSYFYPDSPRNFQITQYDEPIVTGGKVIAEVEDEEHTFTIDRIHLEDDAGMLKHFATFAGVDYNRAGVPLVEIVSLPCMHTPQQAVAFAMGIRAILQYIDVSDCNMEEGSLRFDVNVSIRQKGETGFRNKTEIKNLNSFTYMQIALESEIQRQIKLYTENPNLPSDQVIAQATYRYNPEEKNIVLMRKKEFAEDYRYFPEPDLVPIILTDAYIEEIRKALPELPLQRERRYVKELGLSPDTAFILVSDKPLADYFEAALVECAFPRSLCNWLIIEFQGRFKDTGKSLVTSSILPSHVAKLITMLNEKKITGKIAKAVADDMMANPGKDPGEIVANNPDYQPLEDVSQIEAIVDQVLDEFPESIATYKSGRAKAFSFLVGQVMKRTRGAASPQIVNDLIRKKIEK